MREYADIDSKFRFVVIAAKRAKDLLKGAKPKVKSKSKNLIRIAQEEVEQGLIEFEIVESAVDEEVEEQKDLIVGEELLGTPDIPVEKEKPAEPIIELKDVKIIVPREEKKTKKKTEKKTEKKKEKKTEKKAEKKTEAKAKPVEKKKEKAKEAKPKSTQAKKEA